MIKLVTAVLNYGFKFVSKKNPNDCLISCASLNHILLDHMHLIYILSLTFFNRALHCDNLRRCTNRCDRQPRLKLFVRDRYR